MSGIFYLQQIMINKSDIEILSANSYHLDELLQIGKQTFIETFAAENNPEDMQKYIEESFSIEKLMSELNNKNSEFYIARKKSKTIAYLKLNFGNTQTEMKDEQGMEVERIYVLKEYHGKQIGKILFEKALERAKEKKIKYIWLGVWEKNYRAIRFYSKMGFNAFDKHVFKLGNDEQTDIMMKLYI